MEYLAKIENNSDIDSDEIVLLLKNIYDPDIHYSIYDMGLIYEIIANKDTIHIIMTLTSPSCPEAVTIPDNVYQALTEAFPDYTTTVDVTFEPPWTVENMTDEVKLGLGLL